MVVMMAMTPPSVLLANSARTREKRDSEILKVKQLREEIKTNPTLRKEVETEARQKFEAQRDYAFSQMRDSELRRIHCWGSISRQIAASKVFCAWWKQAQLELEQLRETERSSTEHLARITDALLLAKEDMAWDRYPMDRDHGSTTSSYLVYFMDVVPITSLDAFAQKHQHPPEHPSWIKSRAEKMDWSSTSPPGKRFSLRQMAQILWRPEHYRWLKEGAGLRLFKDSSCDDRTPQNGLRPWAHLADLIWADRGAKGHVVKSNDKS